jgi:hypothetical protein
MWKKGLIFMLVVECNGLTFDKSLKCKTEYNKMLNFQLGDKAKCKKESFEYRAIKDSNVYLNRRSDRGKTKQKLCKSKT